MPDTCAGVMRKGRDGVDGRVTQDLGLSGVLNRERSRGKMALEKEGQTKWIRL